MFERAGLTSLVGTEHIFWSAIEAIIQLHEQRQISGCPHCDARGDGCTVLQAAIVRRGINPPPTA
jgi:hypothetical protein